MLPFLAGKAKKERASAFIDEIRHNRQYDIICLQEVFDEGIRRKLTDGLKPDYPYIVEKASDFDIFNEDSGLFFASKLPILRHTFREFHAKQWGTFDADVDKGVFIACLQLGNEETPHLLHVYNTHLQSTVSYHQVRQKQLSQLRSFIERALKTEKNNNPSLKFSVLLLGDLNVVGDTDGEYKRMMSLLGYPIDLYRKLNAYDEGFTWNSKENVLLQYNNRNDHDLERLDYIFTFNCMPDEDDHCRAEYLYPLRCRSCDLFKPKASNIADITGECDLSDHYGVEAFFSLTRV